MDILDRKILEMLHINARESFATIGKEVGLSAPAIGKRVRQMEEEGIIEGYVLKVNHEKLGIETKAYITLVMHRGPAGTSDAIKQISTMEEVQSCDRITGDDCLCILGYFRNNKHLVSFLEKIAEYGASKTSIILEV
ncbi:Lrp/AsnC family transcriptional regulator [Aquimarina sp. MMG015]|uniref:Lrp/AsnC family transcriptional regulator n=1 Tax=unclassified Aquimarina TaxID=2627091 RepID=UPI000E4BD883|nr:MULTISPECIES: Lrp/AsnC family transcriptional regulator [unclassified Aquimarina]AXT54457.1 Lrp/AsnC family transcriptional regulator [Aquimarina sp. AD1]MBQ4804002.1 Lrp/AsnC family transcriptional regulator [Aquimarina sp. MMG015]RKN36757.1 AsnC family transcriptional regulator [Aquimarina sp. AD1]